MKKETLTNLLKGFDPVKVNTFVEYCFKLETEKKKSGKDWIIKNPWMKHKTDQILAELFKKVDAEGLIFDGQHITLQSTGVSFDYVAFKNKMLLIYPETIFDIDLVYKDDKFSFKKEDGRVFYTHSFANPLAQKESDIIGGYCVIKNARGESLTLLSLADIQKHRKVAKTDYIWKSWFKEMCFKTVSKKACGKHCKDEFQKIENLDNENYDIEKPVEISVDEKITIEKLKTVEEIEQYYKDNVKLTANKKEFIRTCADRKAEICK